MKFKKVKLNDKTENFVDSATGEIKNETAPRFNVKISADMFLWLTEKAKQWIFNKSQLLSSLYFNKNDYFNDLDMIKVFDKAKAANMGIRDFIAYKLNLKDKTSIKSQAHKIEQKHLVGVYVDIKKRKEANMIADSVNLSIQNYGYLKVLFAMETEDLLSFEEMVKIKKEAEKYQLEVGQYIALRVLFE